MERSKKNARLFIEFVTLIRMGVWTKPELELLKKRFVVEMIKWIGEVGLEQKLESLWQILLNGEESFIVFSWYVKQAGQRLSLRWTMLVLILLSTKYSLY